VATAKITKYDTWEKFLKKYGSNLQSVMSPMWSESEQDFIQQIAFKGDAILATLATWPAYKINLKTGEIEGLDGQEGELEGAVEEAVEDAGGVGGSGYSHVAGWSK
jgi:hypothetical protein